MLDYRMHTFLTLCDTLNYRKAAEQLNMTQPAVTQHIQHLEKVYGCRLFHYSSRKLSQTKEGKILENYGRSEKYNEKITRQRLRQNEKPLLRMGVTKTIGDYAIKDKIARMAASKEYSLSVTVDNTANLLSLMDHNQLDLAVIEGFFDKESYGYELFRKEPFVGVCSIHHAFAGKSVELSSLLFERIIVREVGSGTRAIFEQILKSQNFSLDSFSEMTCLSSFGLIEACLLQNAGITMSYEAFAKSNPALAAFTLNHASIIREFNFVYLKHADVSGVLETVKSILKNN